MKLLFWSTQCFYLDVVNSLPNKICASGRFFFSFILKNVVHHYYLSVGRCHLFTPAVIGARRIHSQQSVQAGQFYTPNIFFFFLIYFYLFIYLFLAALGLRCCVQTFSSCREQGLPFIVVNGLLIVVASLVAEHGLQAAGLQQLWHVGSVVVARRFQSARSVAVVHGLSCSTACGIFPDQGSNPCPLHWQEDSSPLRHQGSPRSLFLRCVN